MILAERTGKITAEASHRYDAASGIKIRKRFFLYGIQSDGCNAAVIIRYYLSVTAYPCKTAPALSIIQLTVMYA